MGNTNSFLPEDYLDSKVARRTNLICIGLFLVMIAAIGAAFYVQSQQGEGTANERYMLKEETKTSAKQLRQIDELKRRQAKMVEKARIINHLKERVPRSNILAEMVNNMPQSLSLLEFNLETKNKPGPRARTALDRARDRKKKDKDEEDGKVEIVPRQVLIKVVGIAENENQVTDFLGALSEHPLYVGVALDFIETDEIENTKLFRFGISMQLNQAARIEGPAPELNRDLVQDPLSDQIQIDTDGNLKPAPDGVAGTETNTD